MHKSAIFLGFGVLVAATVIPQLATAEQPEPGAPAVSDRSLAELESLPGGIPEASSSVELAGLMAVAPYRLLDTRDGTGVGGVIAPVGQEQSIDVVVVGLGGVPAAGVDSVALNVTVTGATHPSFLTVWPAGQTRPVASSLNMGPDQSIANLVLAKVGSGGRVSIFNGFGSTDVVADVVGWSAGGAFLHALNPTRILDTREGLGAPQAPVGADSSIDLGVAGTSGVPTSGVDAVVLNVTVTDATSPSFVTVWPAGQPRPVASSLNMRAGETNPNLVVAKVGAGGKVSLYNAAGSSQLIADVVGWLPTGGAYTSINPTRVLDTRSGLGTYGTFFNDPMFGPILRPKQIDFEQRFKPGETVQLQVSRAVDLPPSATSVLLNLTGTQATKPTFVTAWAYGQPQPLASSLNLAQGATRPNLVVAELGEGGYVSLYNGFGYVHLLADVVGYFEARNAADTVDQVAGPLVHVVHAIPSDVTATYGDAEIRKVLDVGEDWIEDNGGRGIRFDTVGGAVEITTLHLDQTAAEVLAISDAYDHTWDEWMVAEGLSVANKSYVVYLDGVDTGGLCGLGGGQQARVFTEACDSTGAGAKPSLTATWTHSITARTTVHELFHVLGAVASCAPHADGSGHVVGATDIMNSTDLVNGSGELLAGNRNAIDPGHDDYWGQGNTTCPNNEARPDISLSPYLDAPD